MACLLPQFMCPSDTLSLRYRPTQHHNTHLKTKEPICFRGYCVSSSTTSLIDVEKLRLPSIDDHSTSVAAVRSLTYTGALAPPVKTSFGATLATETFLTGEDALIAAAAAEALALAKVAVEVAKDAAVMPTTNTLKNLDSPESFTSKANLPLIENAKFTETEHVDTLGHFATTEFQPGEENVPGSSIAEDSDERDNELELLRMQLSESITARSGRRAERKAKREKVAEQVVTSVVTVKPGSSGRKKRASIQEVDYSDPLRYLRGTTSTTKLLTYSQELELSAGIQELLKLEKLHEELVERCGCQPTIAQWAAAAGLDRKTLRKHLNHGIRCKDKMIKSNIRLVISIAKNYQGAGMNLQDLVQEGCRGLVRGAEKFDASKGFKFSTYAHWWIKQAVRKSLSDQSRTIRLPFHMVEATYRVKEARKQLYSKNGRLPNDEEIAEATGLSMKRLMAVLLTPKPPRSLDQKIGNGLNLKPSEVTADPDAETAEDMLMKQFMKEDLDKVLDGLSPRENQVIRSRFGLDDGRMKTLQEIGELIGVSRERVRQIESCAFRKLKNKKRTKHLEQYLISY
ncbi:hypothetical protein CKAN_01316900 [Cinnamomum micranthum f. kanehirae]|uniref:RNA polymerase sigma factor n=1 Tax=Cinnamomum micranthum f. kanehirae TaxID=337451 RepID=A0A3S3NBI5_9MAGN|nr:hypothetical protein CKAN_01316900 [Cinnamomum micranthum f. kanehirae]